MEILVWWHKNATLVVWKHARFIFKVTWKQPGSREGQWHIVYKPKKPTKTFERKRAQQQHQTNAFPQSCKENDKKESMKMKPGQKGYSCHGAGELKKEIKSSPGYPVFAQGCPSPACLFVRLVLVCGRPKQTYKPNQCYQLRPAESPGWCARWKRKVPHELVCKSWDNWSSFVVLQHTKKD